MPISKNKAQMNDDHKNIATITTLQAKLAFIFGLPRKSKEHCYLKMIMKNTSVYLKQSQILSKVPAIVNIDLKN